MQSIGKQKGDSVLPKIRSQQRIHTVSDRKNTEQDKALMNRPLSNNCRTRSLRAFTAKTVRYESSGNTYNKKVDEIQKQTFLVDREIKMVEDEIKTLRQKISKKEPGFNRLNESSASYLTKITSRKNISLDQETIKTELKNLQTKILNYRNKIDTHLEKNKAIQQQIDAFRKEISTLKNINSQLEISFKLTSQKYDEQMQLSKRLDAEIAQKTELTHRKKVENMHQKTQMIKQYDVILKTLDKELNTQKPSHQEAKSEFYLTDIVDRKIESEKIMKSDQKSARQINTGKKPKISQIREKLKNYEKQFEQLKMKVGSSNIEQITKQFSEEYQKNFHQYNFINEMYKEYEDTNYEQLELLQKKSSLIKELKGEKSKYKTLEVQEFKSKIKKINQMKEKIKQDMETYKKLATEMKVYLIQFQMTLPQNQKQNISQEQIHEKSVSTRLNQIYEKYSKQFAILNSQKGREKRVSKNSLTQPKQTIDDLIEEVKKQSEHLKDNRLMTRQELQSNTIQLKEKKMEGSILNQKYKTKKELEKTKKSPQSKGS